MRYDIDIYSDNLMLDVDELHERGIAQSTIDRIQRLRSVYSYMLQFPLKRDREMVDFIESGFHVSKRTAYEDLQILHTIVGTLQQCSKEWHRWRFNNMILKIYDDASRAHDYRSAERAAADYAKYNRLDCTDEIDRGYDNVPPITFTFNVAVLNLKPIPDVRGVIDSLVKKYSGSPVSDIQADELPPVQALPDHSESEGAS
jgi:hypothetical protein